MKSEGKLMIREGHCSGLPQSPVCLQKPILLKKRCTVARPAISVN